MPGIRRIETFTNGTAPYRLENRQETVNRSIEMAKYWIHTSKSDKSDEIHSQWISTLSEGVIVMYQMDLSLIVVIQEPDGQFLKWKGGV
jgi:hypothetical protein